MGLETVLRRGSGDRAAAWIFLAKTPAFHWVYPWWGALPVFITVYIPFFLAANFAYDWQPKRQKMFIGGLFGVNAAMLVLFAGFLKWI